MNVLIVGLGSIANKHIDAIKKINAKAVIYALRSGESGLMHNDVVDIFDIKELDEKPDFAIISNPTYKHEEGIASIVDLTTNLFIEKPLAHSIDVAKKIKEYITNKNIINYVGCNLRFHKGVQFLYNYLNNNELKINEVNVYCGSYLPSWRANVDFRKIYSANENMGGGVHLDLIHELDYIYWFFGIPIKTNKFLKKNSSLNINAVDYANYVLDYESFIVSIILNYYRKDTKRVCEIVCSDRTLTLDLINNSIKLNYEILFHSEEHIVDTYFHQMSYFWSCIKNNQQTFNTIDNALNVLNICL